MARSQYIVNLLKSYMGLELVSSLSSIHPKHVRNVTHTAHKFLTKCHFDST